jgi:hypothetical protein
MTAGRANVPTHEPAAAQPAVSRDGGSGERSAERAADVVARGGSVAGWSFTPALRHESAPAAERQAALIDGAVTTAGQALEPATRRIMETRFGHDFSRVRVHDDARGAAAASALSASAFTLGTDVVFGARGYDPASPWGRHLLAHELAHVVQHERSTAGPAALVQRRSIFQTVGIALGLSEGTWTDQELQDYLAVVRTGQIEGAYDSDNKARAVVQRWKASTAGFDLLVREKVVMIREMLDGPTLGEDEAAILDLLELSDASHLRVMLGPSGVPLPDLESNIDDANRARLDAFVAGRFQGGRAAVLAGQVNVIGNLPATAPGFAFDAAALEAQLDSNRTTDDVIALISALPAADRASALQHLVTVRRPADDAVTTRLTRELDANTDQSRDAAIRASLNVARERQLKTERVMLHFFHGQIPATAAALTSATTATAPAQRTALRAALAPPTHGPAAPGGSTFRSTLPGQSQSYEQKMTALLPTLVLNYHQQIVGSNDAAAHATPARMHTLAEFEAIGNVAKAETDAVLGQFYAPAAHPPLRADRPGHRGNLHDRFSDVERDLGRMTGPQRRDFAKALVFYLFQSDDRVRGLNDDHGAAPRFDNRNRPQNDEARALDRVATQFVSVAANVTRLNEIDRNWPATANRGDISFQLFRAPTAGEDRRLLWNVFQTFIHEYLHTLVHADYEAYANSFGGQSNENNTLIEGVDSLLTEIVWSNIEPRLADPALRRSVEGPTNAALPAITITHPVQQRYPSYTEALRLVGLVGIQNLYAAYFLGLVDRIGGPTRARAGGRP